MALENALMMNDDDFMRAMESQENQVKPEVIEDTQATDTQTPDTETNQVNDDLVGDTEEGNVEVQNEEQSQEVKPSNQEVTDTETKPEEQKPTEETEPSEIDYKAFYETVTQDFKASGKMMPGVKEPEKFIKALQMATDYALKTAALKPVLRKAKMLEGISDDEFAEMLDFRNRNPEVIKKALKETNIDPIDLDLEEINYTPQTKIMSEADYEFKETVERLSQDKEVFNKTQQLVLNELDEVSKNTVLGNPHILSLLHSEIASGRFEQIQAQALQLKTFGGYEGVSDLELYASIAAEMDKQQANNKSIPMVHTNTQNPQSINTVQNNPSINKPNPELEDKKLRAGIQTKPTTKVVKKYDPTKLTDEEFMKLLSEGAEFIN